VSAGCDGCYAILQACRQDRPGGAYEGLTARRNGRVDWSGKVVVAPEHILTKPLRWKGAPAAIAEGRPTRIFVDSMSDLFHPAVSDETIDRVFAVMALATRHTFQVLTKRPERMRDYFETRKSVGLASLAEARVGTQAMSLAVLLGEDTSAPYWDAWWTWPLPNVWLGVSVEDQTRADERIHQLLATPAAVRFISAEPLLGPVTLPFPGPGDHALGCTEDGTHDRCGLDWVIVGGESGPKARPCDVVWIRDIVRQCREAGTAVFVKQLGAHPHEGGAWLGPYGKYAVPIRDRKGGDPVEWPEDLRVREFPGPLRAAV